MNVSELQALIEVDSKIDEARLDKASLDISLLHGKWYGIFMAEARLYRKLYNDLKKRRKFKTEYYLGKCEDAIYEATPLNHKVLRQDLDTYLDADEELCDLDERVNLQKLKVEMCESFIKSLNSRGFNIKSAIEFLKFKNGVI